MMSISVALCTYNGEKYIEEQLKSILNQTILPDEIVICDDGSTDSTVEIITEFIKTTLVNVRVYLNLITLNVVRNFEKAISLCTGDFIFLSDQDDCWKRDKVEKILRYFDQNSDKKVIFTNAVLINENNQKFISKTLFDVVNFSKTTQQLFQAGFQIELLNIDNRVTGATMAFRKDYIISNMPFIETNEILHDEIIAITAINNNCLGFINECLIDYRIHDTQKNGLGCWILNPPSSNVFKCLDIKPVYSRIISDNPELLDRIRFIDKRKYIIKSVFGLLLIVSNIKQYKISYSEYTWTIMKSDINDHLKLNINRLRKYTIHA